LFSKFDAPSDTIERPSAALAERKSLHLGNAGPESLLIHGDNDQALDALSSRLKGQVKCVYIDPPYNNMESYTHYEDRDGHDEWIEKLTGHIKRLKPLLTDDGSLWVSIDDYQVHYLKVELDKVFGRENFITTIVWEHRKSRENRKVFSNNHEYILVYANQYREFKNSRNRLPYSSEVTDRFKNPDRDPRGPWQSISLNVQDGHATRSQFYTITGPNGKEHSPPKGRCWVYNSERTRDLIRDNRIWFGKSGTGVPRLKRFLSEIDGGLTPQTLWRADEVGTTDSAKKDVLKLFPGEKVFDTPKPEQLISRIFQIAANPGDLVLDSFLGSGTSAIAAIESDMRFVGIELGDHVLSHCHERIARLVRKKNIQVKFLELQI
jgi:adenine-specific DNA-methyltransferase